MRTGNYWTLPGRRRLAVLRVERLRISGQKFKTARSVARWLSLIPSVLCVGITGGLAMDNTKEEDDIDFFLIVSPGTIWISRLLAVCIVEVTSQRRKPGDINVKNAICLNMFVTSDTLGLPFEERDIYTSHEVLQMRPLFDRGVYGSFLKANAWVKTFLPNAWRERQRILNGQGSKTTSNTRINNVAFSIGHLALRFLNLPAKIIQVNYMKGKMTTEVVTDTVLRFHPKDARPWIQKKFMRLCQRYKITLDKKFWRA